MEVWTGQPQQVHTGGSELFGTYAHLFSFSADTVDTAAGSAELHAFATGTGGVKTTEDLATATA